MTFLEILDGAEVLSESGDCAVKGLDYDSRRVRPAWVFVAMRGESTDGNRYIDAAIAAGAVAVVTDSAERNPARRRGLGRGGARTARPGAIERQLLQAARRAAARDRRDGNQRQDHHGVYRGGDSAGRRAQERLVGTVEYHLPGEILAAPHTTPESLELNQMFARALARGATEAVMEVSSHALQQGRIFGIPFDVAIFTNLTQDHLDYHGTMAEYFAAKRILFEGCGTEPPRCGDFESGR